MAENNSRSVAEKLAAAKKKHKAYLKEKGLKNNKSKDEQIKENTVQFNNSMENSNSTSNLEKMESEKNLNDQHILKEENNIPSTFETDLPLPQYDYNIQTTGSSLPDPLSFFENFSNVGATFQNITQPLANFFIPTSTSYMSNDNFSENVLPNQILVDENIELTIQETDKTENKNSQNDIQNFFSYDKFKINAINVNPIEKGTKDTTENVETNQIPHQIFDQFTNSEKPLHESQNNEIEYPIFDSFTNVKEPLHELKNQELYPNKLESIPMLNPNHLINSDISTSSNGKNFNPYRRESKNIQENTDITFEVNHVPISTNIEVLNTSLKEEMNDNVQYSSILQDPEKISDETDLLLKQEPNSTCLNENQNTEEMRKYNENFLDLLNQQNFKCTQLSSQLQESEMKYTKLLTDFKTLEIQKEEIETSFKSKTDNEIDNELTKLREDLQCHLQTISMLVTEKTELTTLLNETQSALRNESSQCIDLNNKLKEMKSIQSDLEEELQKLKSEKNNLNTTFKEHGEINNKLNEEHKILKNQFEGLTQDLLESKEKLKSFNENNILLQRQVQELSSQLSLANIKIQQLTVGNEPQGENQIEKLMQEKMSYEKQISFLNDALKSVAKEREETSLQYQQYAEQLNSQIVNLVSTLEQYQKENEHLKIQEENRIKHIGDLEKQIQAVQNDNNSVSIQRNNSFLKKELDASVELSKQLQIERDDLNTNLTKILVDKEMLEKELESCRFSINQLETSIEQLKGSQPDNAVLLATMESDKVAASRAISQNNELKNQMEGMQEVLLKVNNDNVQLTENISIERKINKEFMEKLQKTEISYQTLAEAIEIKDKEIIHLRDYLEQMSKQIVQQEQLTDRLRHYEASDHTSQFLQKELQDAKHMIAHLTNELNILKKNELNQTSQINQTETSQNCDNKTNDSENIDLINELKLQLNNLQIRNNELESLLQNYNSTERKSMDSNGNEALDKETAMKHLEKKFLKTMEEIAVLTEEKQGLEHLVLQLQGETETIGEYVTLYQQQRSILKQRALEKDQQLQQLTHDRETIKANLNKLNSLISKLILEKGAITQELLEQHEHFSKERDDLCAEHQKIHQEINKITSDGLKNIEVGDNSNTQIAEEIISLLSEIKSSNLVEPADVIHHCPWCSGKLITV